MSNHLNCNLPRESSFHFTHDKDLYIICDYKFYFEMQNKQTNSNQIKHAVLLILISLFYKKKISGLALGDLSLFIRFLCFFDNFDAKTDRQCKDKPYL